MNIFTKIITNKKTPKIVIICSLFGIMIVLSILAFKQSSGDSKDLVPGKTKQETFLEKNVPYRTDRRDGVTVYYAGDEESKNNATYVEKNGIIDHYIERDNKKFIAQTLDGYQEQFGDFDTERFNSWYLSGGFVSYVFLKEGLVVIAHPTTKTVITEWHLPSGMELKEFDIKYGAEFSVTKPIHKNQL